MNTVRLSVKAIIVRDGKLLVLRCRDAEGDWYMLPGGGQEHGETVHEALRRECVEEVGYDVRVDRLRYVRDYIAKNHEFAAEEGDVHGVELMFECEIASGDGVPTLVDRGQIDTAWIPLADVASSRLYPKTLAPLLASPPCDEAVYLGDVN
jgi:ADP-ribose pyrophosphatase YjhB (NUDIX family)